MMECIPSDQAPVISALIILAVLLVFIGIYVVIQYNELYKIYCDVCKQNQIAQRQIDSLKGKSWLA